MLTAPGSQRSTPRAAGQMSTPRDRGLTPREIGVTPQGAQHLKALKSNVLGNVASLIAEDSISRIDDEVGSRHPGRAASSRSHPMSARGGVSKAEKAEFEARRKRSENLAKHQKLEAYRAEEQQLVKERCERAAQAREQRFEALMDSIRTQDVLRIEASRIIRQHDLALQRKKEDLYNEWDAQVSARVNHQLTKFMMRQQEDEDDYRDTIQPGDDPLKRGLQDQKVEKKFSITADLVIHGAEQAAEQGLTLKELVKQRKVQEEMISRRGTSRPVLPPQMWEQRQHYASPYGHFVRAVESQGAPGTGFHSLRRMGAGAHYPDESDGVATAGKCKTRFDYNLMPMLEGKTAKEGESALFKTPQGASSGAPCQDHYFYPKGTQVVELEFPEGKRCFPEMRS